MAPTLRYSLAAIAGILTAVLTIIVMELIGGRIYPSPPGLDFHDPQAVKRYVHDLPLGALWLVLCGWMLASFVGTLVAGSIAKKSPGRFAGVVGGVVLLATVANLLTLPHPFWFSLTAVIMIPLAAWLGSRVIRRDNVSE